MIFKYVVIKSYGHSLCLIGIVVAINIIIYQAVSSIDIRVYFWITRYFKSLQELYFRIFLENLL